MRTRWFSWLLVGLFVCNALALVQAGEVTKSSTTSAGSSTIVFVNNTGLMMMMGQGTADATVPTGNSLTYVAGRAFVAGSTTELTTVGTVLVASDPSNLTGTPVSMSVIFPPTDGDTWTYYLNYDAGTLSISPEQVAPTALLSARLSSTSTGSSGGTGSSTPVNKSKYIRVNRANMQQYRYLFNR